MRIVTLDQVQKDLQNLADQVGEKGFVNAKALYMEKVAVVDEEGTPLTADEIEVVLMPKPADNQQDAMEEEEEEKAVEAAPAPKAAPAPRRKAASVAARMSAPAIARPKVWGSLKNFKSDDRGDAVDKALRFGHWLLASKGNRKSLSFCDRHGIEVKAHTEGVNSAGGFLVPDEFETELISLREQFGVFRREARVRPMSSDTLRVPRRSATLSASFVGEATAGTESTQTFESVLLVAKKAMVLTTVSNELNEDAFVNLADDVAGEIAYAFAKKEDECGFIGTGTSTYGGIQASWTSSRTARPPCSTTTRLCPRASPICRLTTSVRSWASCRRTLTLRTRSSTCTRPSGMVRSRRLSPRPAELRLARSRTAMPVSRRSSATRSSSLR
jgi:hypothetical protein